MAIQGLIEELEREGITTVDFNMNIYTKNDGSTGSLDELGIKIHPIKRKGDNAEVNLIKKEGDEWRAKIGNEETKLDDTNFEVVSDSSTIDMEEERQSIKGRLIEGGDLVEGILIAILIYAIYLLLTRLGGEALVDFHAVYYSLGAVVVSFVFRVVAHKINF